jgi:hypothetical protein
VQLQGAGRGTAGEIPARGDVEDVGPPRQWRATAHQIADVYGFLSVPLVCGVGSGIAIAGDTGGSGDCALWSVWASVVCAIRWS